MIASTMGLCRGGALLIAAAIAFAACAEQEDPVILSLDGDEVHRSDFERHLAVVEARGLGPVSPEARRGILDAFLEERALVIEARRRGLIGKGAGSDEELRAVARLLAAAAVPAKVGEDEVEAFYVAHRQELAQPEAITLRQIVVATQHQARDVKRRLARNPMAFDTIARSESRGPEADSGGFMGRFERGQLPAELEAVAFNLRPGTTSEIVQTSLGYHVLRVESRQPARELTLDEAREGIRGRLARERRAEAERAFVAEVLARAKVNHEAALRPPPHPL